jgi:hypothetical protein
MPPMKRALLLLALLYGCAHAKKPQSAYGGAKDVPLNPTKTFGPSAVYVWR